MAVDPNDIQKFRRQIQAYHTLLKDGIPQLPDTTWFLDGVPILDQLDKDAQAMYLTLKQAFEANRADPDDSLTFWTPQ